MRNNLHGLFLTVLLALFAGLFLTACPIPSIFTEFLSYEPLPYGEFWAQTAYSDEQNSYYKVQASELYEGNKCIIWAEDGSGITPAQAKEIANMYDTKIENLVLSHFGSDNVDVMEVAQAITGSEKLIILLLDIKDGLSGGNSYVAGYFTSWNFKREPRSNLKNIIYIDTNPGLLDSEHLEVTYETFAHEFQHLVNYLVRVERGGAELDTWINEGMSTMAEYFYQDKIDTNRYKDFNRDQEGTIAQGNNFFVWGGSKYPNSILDEYATAYMFFQWLYLQSGNDADLFKKINSAGYSDYRAVTAVAGKISGRSEWNDWKTLLGDWLAANYINASSGIHGYNGKLSVSVKAPVGSELELAPGEGVYSGLTEAREFVSSGNIRYVELEKGANKALLTFNANQNKSGTAEIGSLTGQQLASVAPAPVRSLLQPAETPARPRAIDFNDAVRRQKPLTVKP